MDQKQYIGCPGGYGSVFRIGDWCHRFRRFGTTGLILLLLLLYQFQPLFVGGFGPFPFLQYFHQRLRTRIANNFVQLFRFTHGRVL